MNPHNTGKKKTFQSNGFLKYFGWSRNPYNPQNMGKVNSHSKGKIRENKHFKVKHFLNSLYEGEINACPKIWEKCFSIVREKHGKAQTF